MLTRELKVNLKSWTLWTGMTALMYLSIIALYPSLISETTVGAMDKMLNMFPKDMLRAFNFDITSLSSASGWIKSEGAILYMLVGALYSAILGSGILLKEESDGTVEFLAALPVSRTRIALSKYLGGLIYVCAFPLAMTLAVTAGLYAVNDPEAGGPLMLVLMLSPVLTNTVAFSLCMLIATFYRKTAKTLSLSFALVFGSYFLQLIALMSERASFLRYFSMFTLSEPRRILETGSIGAGAFIVSFGLTAVFTLSMLIRYNHKEFL